MKALLVTCIFFYSIIALPINTLADNFAEKIADLENRAGGTIGVVALDTESGKRLEYRAGQRFALCSTFKLLLAAAVLSRVDAQKESLDRFISYGQADMQSYAPITKKHLVEGKMRVGELSAAAIQYSDNTAANLLLNTVGGPVGLTRYLRSLGDGTTRLDRMEPELNSNLPGDIRDTTTPAAMLDTMQTLLIGSALSPASRAQLIAWLMGNTTGGTKLRAGINPAWKVGDKTGHGENGATSDIAIIWPGNKKPFLIAVYYIAGTGSKEKQDAIIAQVGRIVSAGLHPESQALEKSSIVSSPQAK